MLDELYPDKIIQFLYNIFIFYVALFFLLCWQQNVKRILCLTKKTLDKTNKITNAILCIYPYLLVRLSFSRGNLNVWFWKRDLNLAGTVRSGRKWFKADSRWTKTEYNLAGLKKTIRSPCYVSGHGNISVVLLSIEGLRALRFKPKHLNLCFDGERMSYGFRTTSGWVINDIIFIFGWTNPLTKECFCFWLHVHDCQEWVHSCFVRSSLNMNSESPVKAKGVTATRH